MVVTLAGPATSGATRPQTTSPVDLLQLPTPVGEIPLVAPEVVAPERRRMTFVPGPIRDDERIVVRLSPDGRPLRVTVTQRLELSGTGDFAIRERGPALRVTALDGTTAPIIQRGTVVWQGFVPGSRSLAADLELDPAREALLLPLRVELSWRPASGTAPLGSGGQLPGPGRIIVRLINQTSRPEVVPTGDVPASELAGPLDALRRSADMRSADPPPVSGRGLPATLPVIGLGSRTVRVVAPLRIEGSVTVPGVTPVSVSGPGAASTTTGDGATVSGVLQDSAEIALDAPAAGSLDLDLTVVPALDPRRLAPPDGLSSWAAWAATEPPAPARRAATDLLVESAAAAARADDVAPYLGHPGPGSTTTEFRYTLADPVAVVRPRPPLRPRPLPIGLVVIGLLSAAGGGAWVWRRL